MASVGHVIVGLAAGRLWAGGGGVSPLARAMVGFSALSLLPDADVVAFAFGIPYADAFGHRGASHSLAFAAGIGALIGIVARLRGQTQPLRLALLSAAVVMSHPLLDAMTTGGLGVAWAWPWSAERAFLPWRPIPVSPIGAGFISERGLKVALTEVAQLAPLWLWALWPRRCCQPRVRGFTSGPRQGMSTASTASRSGVWPGDPRAPGTGGLRADG